jgi:hypothetical protein
MIRPFFAAAIASPVRRAALRRAAAVHAVLAVALAWGAAANPNQSGLTAVANVALVLGIVEGGAVVGWRLTQLPKSPALEFLLVSPLRPRGVFLAETLVGVTRFALVQLAGLPALAMLAWKGVIAPVDLWALAFMPFAWGVVTGLGITAWAYEPRAGRKAAEVVALLGVLFYLVVGVLAAEKLPLWLQQLPPAWANAVQAAVLAAHNENPFGVVRNWFDPARGAAAVWEPFVTLHRAAGLLVLLFAVRAAFRLKPHFHDRHYRPLTADRLARTEDVGDRPLSWWAVKRVMEYGGRVNLWLAGGFGLAYAAYLIAGDQWPAWMGRLVFQLFEKWGGAATVAAAMCVLAAVPAAFQFGLWDPTITDRCRRLELLLLTDLDARDYWHASLAAAWRRGHDYLYVAGLLWVALVVAGRVAWYEGLAAAAGGIVLWMFCFAVGFRAFCTGRQASGIASFLTLGMPLVLFGLLRAGLVELAGLVPVGACYLPAAGELGAGWAAGLALMGAATVWLTRRGLARCDDELRAWYDANQGRKTSVNP